MRSSVTFAVAALWCTSGLACNVSPQMNVDLEPRDRAVLTSLGKAINAQELVKDTPVAELFSNPSGVLTLSASDSKMLSQALSGLRKATACHADGVPMERILEGDTPGIRFLKQIEECLADACVTNQ